MLMAGSLMSGCSTVSPRTKAMMEMRSSEIAREPRGDYWVGRRYWVMRTQFWGYVRRPGQGWDKARLVVKNESIQRAPDHMGGVSFGYDNNYEYRIWGRFSGDKVYEPNSNMFLPEFVLERTELISTSPGFLFHPEERRSSLALPQVR